MYCLGTYILYSFSFFSNGSIIILFEHFYLFQNVLIDLLNAKGSHLYQKQTILDRRLNLVFQNFKSVFQRMHYVSVTSFFSTYGYLFELIFVFQTWFIIMF